MIAVGLPYTQRDNYMVYATFLSYRKSTFLCFLELSIKARLRLQILLSAPDYVVLVAEDAFLDYLMHNTFDVYSSLPERKSKIFSINMPSSVLCVGIRPPTMTTF